MPYRRSPHTIDDILLPFFANTPCRQHCRHYLSRMASRCFFAFGADILQMPRLPPRLPLIVECFRVAAPLDEICATSTPMSAARTRYRRRIWSVGCFAMITRVAHFQEAGEQHPLMLADFFADRRRLLIRDAARNIRRAAFRRANTTSPRQRCYFRPPYPGRALAESYFSLYRRLLPRINMQPQHPGSTVLRRKAAIAAPSYITSAAAVIHRILTHSPMRTIRRFRYRPQNYAATIASIPLELGLAIGRRQSFPKRRR